MHGCKDQFRFFFRILISVKPQPWELTWQYLGLEFVNFNAAIMRMQNFIKIVHTVQEIGPVSLFFQNLELGKASTDEKWHLAIPWAISCQYQYVCKALSKYSVWLKSYGQFTMTTEGHTSQTDYRQTQTDNRQITQKQSRSFHSCLWLTFRWAHMWSFIKLSCRGVDTFRRLVGDGRIGRFKCTLQNSTFSVGRLSAG